MPKKASHRRPMPRSLTRGLMVAGVGGAVIAVPLLTAAGATAAPVAQSVAHQAVKAPAQVRTASTKAVDSPYTVVPGDSLSKIASDHKLRGGWERLYHTNREAVGSNPSLIHPGLKLDLHGKYTPVARHTGAASGASNGSAHKTVIHTQDTAKTTAVKTAAPVKAAAPVYADNLDGWIRQSLDIMAQHGIPGTYNGIYRNVMRESSGNPMAINNWDSNAAKGTPSKGLLQVIDPTFLTYHVSGTSMDPYNPVANITAACNYAAAVYGSIDNVNGPY
ncbi:transglycosylase SLT domain-containing protein [Streptomyces fuscigenes]|uniref:transglycosylase SLT domain-containing protein n=1 Tax=Streptomyces fuscigenes TaxID=1528880 RepID=UPI001F3837BA|nr:LysM peptidoglycan-binding domain-containing protein [Streptomyces fuscigenes]MCF3964812.1 LysM peptidoglycan-binding domain-containing protein [Streptomyces fuscigenes]